MNKFILMTPSFNFHRSLLLMFIVDFDVDANGGAGNFTVSNDPKLAKRFDSYAAAFEAWETQSRVMPIRPDGGVNRPLTALSISIIDTDTIEKGVLQ